MKLSTPPVNPSARPRNIENEPSVTIKAGMRPRVIKSPFKLPASAPRQRVAAAATPIESPPSRQSLPKTTAERPISDPTDRSMPPVVITGVRATAKRPISTLRRSTSNALASDKKLVPMTAKTATSRARRPSRIVWPGSSRYPDGKVAEVSSSPLRRRHAFSPSKQSEQSLGGPGFFPVQRPRQTRSRMPLRCGSTRVGVSNILERSTKSATSTSLRETPSLTLDGGAEAHRSAFSAVPFSSKALSL